MSMAGSPSAFRRGADAEETVDYFPDPAAMHEAGATRFDGTVLFRRLDAGRPAVVVARRFRHLSVGGLEVHSPTFIDSLMLEGERCEIAIEAGHAGDVQCTSRDEIRLVINGTSWPPGPGEDQVVTL